MFHLIFAILIFVLNNSYNNNNNNWGQCNAHGRMLKNATQLFLI